MTAATNKQQSKKFFNQLIDEDQETNISSSPKTTLIPHAVAGATNPHTLLSLSDDELSIITSFLQKRDIVAAGATCKRLDKFFRSDDIWKPILKRVYQPPLPFFSEVSKLAAKDTILNCNKGYKAEYARRKRKLVFQERFHTFVVDEVSTRFQEETEQLHLKVALPMIIVVFLFLAALLVTGILYGLYLDDILGSAPLMWLVPFCLFGFCIAPLTLCLVPCCGIADGQFPLLSFVHDICCFPVIKRQVQRGLLWNVSDSRLLQTILCCFRTTYTREVGETTSHVFCNQTLFHLMFIPTLCVGIAVKMVLLRDHAVWSYVFIPTYLCWMITSLENMVTACRMMTTTNKCAHLLQLAASTMLSFGFTASGVSMALAIGKLDGWSWLTDTPYAVTFIGAYIAPAVFFIAALLIIFRTFMAAAPEDYEDEEDACSNCGATGVISVLLLPVLGCIYAVLIMLTLRADGRAPLLFSYILIPVEIASVILGVYTVGVIVFVVFIGLALAHSADD